ncbi:hypothetical protein ScPMuIL_015960 [Solemya velum]
MALWLSCGQSKDEIQECMLVTCVPHTTTELICDGNTSILVENVTSLKNGLVDNNAFQNIGRMCTGKPWCPLTNFCQTLQQQTSIKVTYFCIEDRNIEKHCQQTSEISRRIGFVQSPDYPAATKIKSCQWKILVPKHFYIHIRLHEVESGQSATHCKGGLRLTTAEQCSNYQFNNSLICGEVQQNRDFIGCGNVSIELSCTEGLQLRFWLSFQVRSMSSPLMLPSALSLAARCPYGTAIEHVLPEIVDTPYIATGWSTNQTELVPTSTKFTPTHVGKSPTVFDSTEKTVLYVSVAIAAASLTSLVIVLVVCIRRQRKQKQIAQPQTFHFNERPLPPIDKSSQLPLQLRSTEISKPVLQASYSHVADELPYRSHTAMASNTSSPAYAEIDQDAGVPQPIAVSKKAKLPNGVNRKSTQYEHLYSELNDDRKDYVEINDNSEQSPCLEHGDQVQLIQSKDSPRGWVPDPVKRLSAGKGNPYATTDLLAQHGPYGYFGERTVSKSESDDSFEMTENEIYEPFETAHV